MILHVPGGHDCDCRCAHAAQCLVPALATSPIKGIIYPTVLFIGLWPHSFHKIMYITKRKHNTNIQELCSYSSYNPLLIIYIYIQQRYSPEGEILSTMQLFHRFPCVQIPGSSLFLVRIRFQQHSWHHGQH